MEFATCRFIVLCDLLQTGASLKLTDQSTAEKKIPVVITAASPEDIQKAVKEVLLTYDIQHERYMAENDFLTSLCGFE